MVGKFLAYDKIQVDYSIAYSSAAYIKPPGRFVDSWVLYGSGCEMWYNSVVSGGEMRCGYFVSAMPLLSDLGVSTCVHA